MIRPMGLVTRFGLRRYAPVAAIVLGVIATARKPPVSRGLHRWSMPKRNGSGIALLADPTRRRIIAALALRPQRPSRLAAALSLSRPALARQLRLLEVAGLVNGHAVPGDGRGVLYTINPRSHGAITAWLAGTEVGLPPSV